MNKEINVEIQVSFDDLLMLAKQLSEDDKNNLLSELQKDIELNENNSDKKIPKEK